MEAIVVQAYIYRRQWEIMQRQIESLTVSERAYLGIKSIGMTGLAIGQSPVIKAVIQNYGRTPAYRVKAPAMVNLEFLGSRPTETVQSEYPGEGI